MFKFLIAVALTVLLASSADARRCRTHRGHRGGGCQAQTSERVAAPQAATPKDLPKKAP